MKKSQLKQFIKEEILNVLKESINEIKKFKQGDRVHIKGKPGEYYVKSQYKNEKGEEIVSIKNPKSNIGSTTGFIVPVKNVEHAVSESVNEVQQTFDGLMQLAKKVRGFKQISKSLPVKGFSIPYEYGNVEFHDEGYEDSVGVYWQNDDGSVGEYHQPLSVAYRIVKGKIEND